MANMVTGWASHNPGAVPGILSKSFPIVNHTHCVTKAMQHETSTYTSDTGDSTSNQDPEYDPGHSKELTFNFLGQK